MNLTEFVSLSLAVALPFVGLGLAILLSASVVAVGGREVALVERRWFGKPLPDGRVVALRGEIGVQARGSRTGVACPGPFSLPRVD